MKRLVRDLIALAVYPAIIRKHPPVTLPEREAKAKFRELALGAYAYADEFLRARREWLP